MKATYAIISVLLVALLASIAVLHFTVIPNPLLTKDRTASSPAECPVHGIRMEPAKAEIVYGLVDFHHWYATEAAKAGSLESFVALQQTRFPFARPEAFGGCVLAPGIPKYARVRVCPSCAADLRAWLK